MKPVETDLQKVLAKSFDAVPIARRAEDMQLRILCGRAEDALADFADATEVCDRARGLAGRSTGAAAMRDQELLRGLSASDAVITAVRAKRLASSGSWLRRLFGRRRVRMN